MDIKHESYVLAHTWAKIEDLKSNGQRVAVNKNTLETNQLGADTQLAGYEAKVESLKELLTLAIPVLIRKAGLEIKSVQEVLDETKARIGLRNRQIRDLRRELRKKS